MTVTLPRRRSRPARGAEPAAHRGDIEGLRAVAVLLVVLAHAGVPGLAGGFVGVDVFFVISGFLITGLLRREHLTTGRIRLTRFYARRAVRLLPLATLVIAVTLAGAWCLAPPVRFSGYAADALAAATYTMNVRLDTTGTDYFGDPAPSPFQHFWSLAVEEQFYLLWPLLVARGRLGPVLMAAVTLGSFAWSLHSASYFGAAGRAWELGAGALLALVVVSRHRPWLGRAGLAMIGAAAVLFDETTRFPGTAALLPVLGAVAVIAAGGNRLLDSGPMRWLGRMSYGWYLWHWPLLLLAPAGPAARITAAVAALGLAVVSHHLLENPVRHHRVWTVRPRRGLLLGLGLSASAAAVAGFGMLYPPEIPARGVAPDASRAVAAARNPAGALARMLDAGVDGTDLPGNLSPTFEDAARQRLAPQLDGCHVGLTGPFRPKSDCSYTAGRRTVVLFGDSHALQWFPTLETLARRNGWRLYSFTRSSCSPAQIALDERRARTRYLACDAWRTEVVGRISRLRPDLLVVSSSVNYRQVLTGRPADPDAVWQTGWVRTLATLKRFAGRVTMIADTPFLTVAPADCLSTHPTAISRCAVPRADVLPEPRWREQQRAISVASGVPVIDPVPWLCTTRCPLVVGNTLIYRDSNHLTEAYARLVAPLLGPHLR